ncbi:conserved hypothetical protein [Thermosediminibacter oceani DSM 16646]|uniref:Uncharacterized protein n=2 Tax=Thermosediminibacter TaxID=291988 RepID=D9S0E5_THEOJ|nr:conserved hypothetical protein [Thermosediminibacter oceani DSM 16646]
MIMGVDIEGLINEVSKCCLGESVCGKCDRENCLIGYCKKMLTTSLKQRSEFIDGGIDNLPYYDTKIYDDVVITDAIGYLLNQCRNCNLYHDENCIINIVRSALEIILLGDAQEYKGSVLIYLNDIKKVNEKVADKIFEAFNRRKNKQTTDEVG